MRYQFTGTQTEVFPTIVTELGTLVCEPGDLVELDVDVDHPRLIPATSSKAAPTHIGSLLRDELEPAEPPAPEADPVPNPDQSTTEV